MAKVDISTHSLTRRLTQKSQPLGQPLVISTHSLTRRLTWVWFQPYPRFRYFNSQPHKEADCCHERGSAASEYFNSQPHKEADVVAGVDCRAVEHFNSQPHKEADVKGLKQKGKYNISTHSLTRRLT